MGGVFLCLDLSEGRTPGIIPSLGDPASAVTASASMGLMRVLFPLRFPGDGSMFLRTNNGPISPLSILQPGYGPLIGSDARGAGCRGHRSRARDAGPRPYPGATSSTSRWTLGKLRFGSGSRSDRVLDGDERLETRDGPQLENGRPKDGVSPAEGQTQRVQGVRIRL